MLETTQIKQRLPFIDLIRGITIIEMISYHFLWDLVYLYNADIPWYKSHGAYIWQQSICWTFILLAGFSWHLGKKHMKRGLWAFGGGVVISLVTAIVLPNDRVRYGVLTLIGSCILIWILLDMEMSRNVQSGNTQNLKSMVIQRSFPKWSVAERRKTAAASDQAAVCACAHSRYFAGGSPSGLRV